MATAVAMRTDVPEAAELRQAPAAAPRDVALPLTTGGELARSGGPYRASAARIRIFSVALVSFVLVVALPTGIAGVYYLAIAADQYIAEFHFGLRSAEPVRGSDTPALVLGSAAPLQSALDSYAVAQYIASPAIVADLGKTLDVRAMFATPAADWPARLLQPASAEELLAYWRRHVDAFFDPTNGTITVRVRAFTPTDALALARGVLATAERLVNDLSARARRDALRNSEREVAAAERRLLTAQARLRDYRDRHGLIDPHKAADANSALAGRLRDELLRADTELSTMHEYLQTNAPALKLLEARIESLRAQRATLENEAARPATPLDHALSDVMGPYEELESERHFAETAYQRALDALDRARLNADRQQVYVADFVPPSLPEESLYPRRWRSLGVVFFGALVIWFIGALTAGSVRDHL